MTKVTHDYGSVEFYADQFSDLLADVQADTPQYADNIINGFLMSVDDWLKYHQVQVDAYANLRERIRQALAM